MEARSGIYFNGLDGGDIQIEKSSSTSVDSHKRRKPGGPGGRPKKTIRMEELLECKGYKLEDAAEKLGISRSTLQRRVFEQAGYKTWTEFQQSITDSQCVHGKQRIQGEDKVPINVEHKGEKIPFDLPLLAMWQALRKRIKDSLKLKAGTYEIKYFDGKEDLSIKCNESLESCLRRRTGPPIVLKVVEHTKSG